MDVKTLLSSLHPLERAVLPHLPKGKTAHDLQKASGLQDVEVSRALQWLDNKGIVKLRTATDEVVTLGPNGRTYLTSGLPEIRFLQTLARKPIPLPNIAKEARLDTFETNAALGNLRKNGAITIDNGVLTITNSGKDALSKPNLSTQFLTSLTQPRSIKNLTSDETKTLKELQQRKDLIEIKFERTAIYTITALGKEVCASRLEPKDFIDRLTADHLTQGIWKGKTIRRYDVAINVPSIKPGRHHHYKSFLDSVRHKFASLGFTQMHGPLVENDFWDMDALFMPQFHSARQIHQGYYVQEPAALAVDPALIKRVKACHEHGGKTGSKGWGYTFDTARTQKTLLRTQGTACSARMLANKNLKIPGKYFGITKNFRYDVIDATHLPDFFQTEGIVVEDGLTFGHLKGILKMFADEFAHADKIKLKPGYFPFTEPSVELHAKHPDMGWIELGGAGMFRPELLEPFGITVPVIAWGMGIDRIGMFNLGIKDIRDLYSQDLSILRSARMI